MEEDNKRIDELLREQPKTIEMVIKILPNGQAQVVFPFLGDKIMTYGVLKVAEKVLDDFYKRNQEHIVKPTQNIINIINKSEKIGEK